METVETRVDPADVKQHEEESSMGNSVLDQQTLVRWRRQTLGHYLNKIFESRLFKQTIILFDSTLYLEITLR